MKLKKVTALLLATSMVLSSVSVASFADELVFEDEVVATEDNAGEEVSFDDVVFEDAAEEEADYSDEVFVDEVVEEDTVAVDEVFYEEVVEEQPVEEQADPNADIYAALAGDEEVVNEDVVVEDIADEQTVTDEADYATAVTATLAVTEYTNGVTADAPVFNFVGAPAGTTIEFEGGWNSVIFTNNATQVQYSGNPGELSKGTYTAQFDATKFKGGTQYTVTAPACTITVKNQVLYATFVDAEIPDTYKVYYGTTDPTSTFDNKLLQLSDTSAVMSGTANFTTTYSKGGGVGKYSVTYQDGLSASKVVGGKKVEYDVLPAPNDKATFEVLPALVTVVPTAQAEPVPYGTPYTPPTYTLEDTDTVHDPGASSLLDNEIDGNKVALSIFVTKVANSKEEVTVFEPGVTYHYSCVLQGISSKNFEVIAKATSTYAVDKVKFTFENNTKTYDGKPYGIIVTPDPTTITGATVKYGYTSDQGSATTTSITRTNVGTTVVYYFVEQGESQILTDAGYKTITILSNGEEYKAVEAMIDALPEAADVTADTKAAADEAKAAYDALSDAQKALIPEAKVQKLNDVKAAADAAAEKAEEDKKAAKAVEDLIDALPAAAEATADTKPAADAAKEAYDALTDAQKALVPADKVQKLDDVKAAADAAAEKKDEEDIEELNENVDEVSEAKTGTEGKAAAEKAKEAYENLSPEAKAKLTEDEIKAYEKTQEAYRHDKEFTAGSDEKATKAVYRVLSTGEVTYQAPVDSDKTWYVVPNQVKHNGFMYRVVKVSKVAFNGCEKATKIVVGKHVLTIGAYAFKNTKAMKTLKIKTTNLAAEKVTNAFVASGKSGGAKLTVNTPANMTSAYESLFKGEGGMNASATFTK
jgi:hypothetical protein